MRSKGKQIFGLFMGFLSFVVLIFVINTIQMASVLLYPFSRGAFREVNRWCARTIWGFWVIQAEVLNDIEVRFTGDRIRPLENALVLANHQSMADVMVLMCFAWRCGRLGDMKWFVKDIIKWFPGFGWGMKFLDCVFVKRDWAKDKGEIERLFGKYKTATIPLFLVSFLEGTRRTPKKLEQTQAYAIAKKLYVPQHTLVPRTKGFTATIAGLGEHLDAVYDVTIGYPDRIPTLIDCFAAKPRRIEVHVRRFAIQTLPRTDETALVSWVLERFQEKDQLLARFAEIERFPGLELPGRVRIRDGFLPERLREAPRMISKALDGTVPR